MAILTSSGTRGGSTFLDAETEGDRFFVEEFCGPFFEGVVNKNPWGLLEKVGWLVGLVGLVGWLFKFEATSNKTWILVFVS